jgi:two-component system sensor histidine kinase AlgZ
MPELCRLPRLAAMLGLAELVVVCWPWPLTAVATGPWRAAVGQRLRTVAGAGGDRQPVPAAAGAVQAAAGDGAVAAIALAALIAVVCAGIVHALYAVLGDSFANGISFGASPSAAPPPPR